MKKYKPVIFFFFLFLVSCTKDFEEINSNPNSPEKITTPGVLFTNVIRGSVNDNFSSSYRMGVIVGDMNYNNFSGDFSNWARADASGLFLWKYYDYIRDLNEVISIADAGGMGNYKGIALVLRSWMFQNLTDLYGPIPFREAANAKLEGINRPKYEQQQTIYQGLLADLEEASTLLGSTTEKVEGDILFSGDISRWKKFSTGLMIRLLMRQSKQVDPSSALANILNNPGKYPLFTSNADQAALQYIADNDGNSSPLFTRSASDYVTSTRVSKNLVDNLKLLNDPRLPVYALPTQVSVVGTNPDPAGFDYVGGVNANGPLGDPRNFSAPGILWAPRSYSPDLASRDATQGIILTYSEEQFNLAEAAEKGYISGGAAAAEAYYLNGIKDQFAYYAGRVGTRYAASYLKLKGEDVIPGDSYYTQSDVAYTGTQEQKLEKIARQKWLSLYFVGFEAWFEWRRTGFPGIVVGTQGPGYIARRCLYPADETRINVDNYNQAVQWLGADDLKSRVWWDK
ncbi:MAG: SusD/RagB family nutrient-binding outer membrane lipoprotein [Chitinophagaceae bacterium]|nr:SusD/RagB family nutrient-binding outer membrane lipoprotein [Chitinophagaceae bacterium]